MWSTQPDSSNGEMSGQFDDDSGSAGYARVRFSDDVHVHDELGGGVMLVAVSVTVSVVISGFVT